MPRFFFHVDDGTFTPDREGTELADRDAAKSEAVSAAGEILNSLDGQFWSDSAAWRMHVTDEEDILLFTLRFSSDVPSAEVKFEAPSKDLALAVDIADAAAAAGPEASVGDLERSAGRLESAHPEADATREQIVDALNATKGL